MTGFIAHLIVYAAVNGFLIAIWAMTGDDESVRFARERFEIRDEHDFWPIWPMMGWGVALAIHFGLAVLTLPRKRRRRRMRRAAEWQRLQAAYGAPATHIPTAPPADPQPARKGGRRWVVVMLMDVSGSTRYNEVLGDEAWSRLLISLRETVRGLLAQHHGHEVGTQGDSLLAHFDSPADAVQCAIDVQRALAERREGGAIVPQVRIGVHAGDVVDDGDGDIVGRVVNLVARVTDAAEPGEILVTEPVADEVGSLIAFEDRGLSTLKGVARRRHLLAAVWGEGATAGPSANGATADSHPRQSA